MLATTAQHTDSLPSGHPCFGCEARSAAVCRLLECDELAAMRRLGWTIRLDAGQPLFHEGDPATRVFTLTHGALKLYKLLPDGRRQVTGFMLPGDFLGITIDDDHAFTVEALTQSKLCWFPRDRFGAFVEMHPELERGLYRLAAHELAAAQAQMVLLGRKTAEERVASFFIDLLERGDSSAERMIDLPMSRLDIADYLGLTKETVSRVLAALKGRRIVRLVTLSRIEILDLESMRILAEGASRH